MVKIYHCKKIRGVNNLITCSVFKGSIDDPPIWSKTKLLQFFWKASLMLIEKDIIWGTVVTLKHRTQEI